MRLNMHKLKNKFKRLLMSAATIGTACLLAGCGAGAAAGTDNSGVTESQAANRRMPAQIVRSFRL